MLGGLALPGVVLGVVPVWCGCTGIGGGIMLVVWYGVVWWWCSVVPVWGSVVVLKEV